MTTTLGLELARLRALGKSGRTEALKALRQQRKTAADPGPLVNKNTAAGTGQQSKPKAMASTG